MKTTDKMAEDYANMMGLCIDEHIGGGVFGEAYLTECNQVIKVTVDKLEFLTAVLMEPHHTSFTVAIYDVFSYDETHKIILMEYLDSPDILFYAYFELKEICKKKRCRILDIDSQKHHKQLSQDALNMLDDFQKAAVVYDREGLIPSDIHPGNIGVNQYGHYVLFDQRDRAVLCRSDYDEESETFYSVQKTPAQTVAEQIESEIACAEIF